MNRAPSLEWDRPLDELACVSLGVDQGVTPRSYIRTFYHRKTVRQIARDLGTTRNAIIGQARRMKLCIPDENRMRALNRATSLRGDGC